MVAMSTAIEIFLYQKSQKIQTLNENRNKGKNIFLAFSLIRNTKNLFSLKNNYQSIHTLTFIFILWFYVSRYYVGSLTMNLIGFKRVLNSLLIRIISEKKYFWVRTLFPLGTIYLFG
jgi:hypothetical protein